MPKKTAEPWYRDVASLMLRDRMPFRAALVTLNIHVSGEEADKVEHSAAFRKMLDQEQQLLYQELASNPNFNKQSVVGGMLHAVQQLLRAGEFDKAITGFLGIAKIQNWIGAESNINVMLGVSQRDIDEARAKLQEKKEVRIN